MSTAISKHDQQVNNLKGMLTACRQQILDASPKQINPERIKRMVMTTVRKQPKLLECDHLSVLACVVQAVLLGFEPDNMLGFCYLVPYGRECTLIIGYRGLVDLARRSGQLSTIYADIVYEKDFFEFEKGLEPVLKHRPAQSEDRGKPIAAYSVAQLRDGGKQYDWMWKADIEKIRKRSKASGSGPWVTDWEEMAKKTVIRRMAKLLPMSIEAQKAITFDERPEYSDSQGLAQEIFPGMHEGDDAPKGLDAVTNRIAGELDYEPEPEQEAVSSGARNRGEMFDDPEPSGARTYPE